MNDTDDTTEHPLLYQSVYDLPYFQGDFWISEVEKILYELDGYGLPGDTNAAMRYWWKEEKKKKRLQPKNKKKITQRKKVPRSLVIKRIAFFIFCCNQD